MSAVSKDDSASQYSSFLRSGAGSPSLVSRSVVSMSPSHAGMLAKSTNKSPRHQPKVCLCSFVFVSRCVRKD
jgi:hypothetical protein